MEILERNGIQIPTTDHRVGSNKRRKSENLAEARSVKIKMEQTEAADSANKSLSRIHQCELIKATSDGSLNYFNVYIFLQAMSVRSIFRVSTTWRDIKRKYTTGRGLRQPRGHSLWKRNQAEWKWRDLISRTMILQFNDLTTMMNKVPLTKLIIWFNSIPDYLYNSDNRA